MDRLEQIGENLKYGYTMARHGTQEGIRLQMLKDIRYLYDEIRMKKWFEKRMEFLSKLSDRLNDELHISNPTTDDKITTNEQPIKNNIMTIKERIEFLNKLQELHGNKELVIKIEIQNGTDTNNN
jgi:hypothetical protein